MQYPPVADSLEVNTCTVMSVVDGLLRVSTIATNPSSSLVVYADLLKVRFGPENSNSIVKVVQRFWSVPH